MTAEEYIVERVKKLEKEVEEKQKEINRFERDNSRLIKTNGAKTRIFEKLLKSEDNSFFDFNGFLRKSDLTEEEREELETILIAKRAEEEMLREEQSEE